MSEPFVIQRRGETPYRVISVRLRVDQLEKIDQLALEGNLSRNRLVTILIEYSLQHIVIQ